MADRHDAAPLSVADQWVDDLAPEDLDWRGLVIDYPVAVLTVAAVGGFLLGWAHGDRIVGALSEVASERVGETVDRYVDFGRRH